MSKHYQLMVISKVKIGFYFLFMNYILIKIIKNILKIH